MSFRMMPRQVNTRPNETHTRFGFFMYNHPLGSKEHNGQYLASWEDENTAFAAAYCLGISPYHVTGIGYIPYVEPIEGDWRSVSTDQPDWKDVGKMVELQKDGDPLTRFRGELEADAWFTGEEEIPICKVGERSIHDFTQWRVIYEEKK